MTGRITDFIPFLPVSRIEQAAIADKYLSQLGEDFVQPLDLTGDPDRHRFVGNVDLRVEHCYSICKTVAEHGYVKELGARSIINTIDRDVTLPLLRVYLSARDELQEKQRAVSFVVGVNADSDVVEVSGCL